MTEYCTNCGSEIVVAALFKSDNKRYQKLTTDVVNFINKTTYSELCESCGSEIADRTFFDLKSEFSNCQSYLKENIIDFPMMTLSSIPTIANYKIKNMVTANVTVGTGMFSELSQGFSDLFGMTNTESGMALKINSGESTARSIVVNKALTMGANCIFGVDIDYGTTNNNAATVNMQGTAVFVDNLNEILDESTYKRAAKISEKYARANEIARWLRGEFD